ncbi:SMI1/KNR4 family protein [Nocardia ignorata]|uniref:Cell wall assembly regulator SMI1 n=1 Tax=Nocardia ignorata TaxID=145285 RepID=A0A4R6PST8_NOCIG|nr:SMI1/KNR4 family protein [Nocardia ignorata]TDP41090.1 hypothetical protein DFR75_101188 [Nocardia ignorata]
MSDVTNLAHQIWNLLVKKGFEPVLRRGSGDVGRYQEWTGVPAPPEVADLWSVLAGRDILGMCLEGPDSAGQYVAARANEAESSGPGEPFEELDGSTDGAVRKVWWDRGWCALYATADHAIAVDSHPGATGQVGQVVYCEMDMYGDREAVWESVEDFLRDLLAVISSDGLIVEDGFGLLAGTDGDRYLVSMAVLEMGQARRDGRPVPLVAFADDRN